MTTGQMACQRTGYLENSQQLNIELDLLFAHTQANNNDGSLKRTDDFKLKGKGMLKHFLFLVFVAASTGAQAEVFMCKKPSGETEFSDTPCKAGSSSKVVPDRDHLTPQQEQAAQKKLQQQRKEANDAAAQRSAAQANKPPRGNGVVEQTPPPPEEVYEGGGCYDGGRRNTNCAGDPYRRPVPDRKPVPGGRPRPVPR